ncbi:MAG: MFS transporter [Bacteroidota bacterium]
MPSNKDMLVKITILVTSMMTVMAGATIAPSLPEMTRAFPENANAEALVKLVLTLPGLFIAATAPISGWLIDKYGRIPLMIVMLLIYGIAGTAGLYLNTLNEILVSRAILGIAVGGIMPTSVALIGDYYEGNERQKFLGIQSGVMALAGTLFITGGGLLADIGWRYPFLIYAVAFLAVPLVIMFLKEPKREKITQSESSQTVNIPSVAWVVYVLSFLGMVTFYVLPVHIPFLILEVANVGNTAVGIALAFSTLISGLAAFNYPTLKSRLTHYQIYGISFFLMGIGFLILSQAGSYFFVFPGLFIAGAGAGLVMPNSSLCLVTLSTPSSRGKILGLLTTFIFLGQFASPLFTGPIVNISSIKMGFLYMAMAIIIVSIIALIRNRRLML